MEFCDIKRQALATVILNSTPNIGDYVRIDTKTLMDAGVAPDKEEYGDWLLKHGLRQYGKRKGVYRIGRRVVEA